MILDYMKKGVDVAVSNVFISYSRKDIAFARLLHKALEGNNLESWIDWQDIPPTTEWLSEIFTAIEQADIFIFMISNTSVESEICKLEINHAMLNNKRLIPIVIDEVDPSKVTEQLAAINWLFVREGDEFSRVFLDLIKAIETDYAWLKEHTRLQVRALEWQRKKKDSGCLLQGNELSAAEKWLEKSMDKDTPPTDLHQEFIATSRKAKKKRRMLIIGIMIGVATLFIAGGFIHDAVVMQAMKQHNSRIYSRNLIHHASYGNIDAALEIIAMGAEINALDYQGKTPLHLAAENGHNSMISILINNGAEVNKKQLSTGATSLHYAAVSGYESIVMKLLEAGANIDEQDDKGFVPLHYAAAEGHLEVVKLLVNSGAIINQTDNRGETPLNKAEIKGQDDIVVFLDSKGAK